MSARSVFQNALTAIFALTLSLSAEAGQLWVSNTHSNTLSIIDTETRKVVETVNLGGGKPNRIDFTPDRKQLWIVNDAPRT